MTALPRPADDEAIRYEAAGFWRAETLQTRVASVARLHPDKPAGVDAQGRRLTYAELHERAAKFAAGLAEVGIGRGDVVGMQMSNRVEALVAMCGVERVGAVVNALLPIYRAHELSFMANATRMIALIVPGIYRNHDHDALALEVARQAPSLQVLITMTERPDRRLRSLKDVSDVTDGSSRLFFEPSLDANDPVCIIFTSGTTSRPKGVVHTHNTTLFGNREVAKLLALDENDVVFIPSPVGHGTGYVWGIRLALGLGATAVLQDVWNAETAAHLIAEHGCTYTMAATTFAQDLLLLDQKQRRPLDSLRYFTCGGASIPTGLRQAVRQRFGWELLRLYGQTEAFLSTHVLPSDPIERMDTSDGRPIPGVEVTIVDERGEPCPAERVGEVVVRGPHRCTGFLRPEDADDRFPGDGWIRSSDLGVLTEDGYLVIRGRTRDMINRGGLKYNPGEIEDVLHRHSSILRVSVVRVPDDRLGELGCAVVVPKPGCSVDLADLTNFLRAAGVAPYKWPERIEVVEELPMTASGKVQKFVLERQLTT